MNRKLRMMAPAFVLLFVSACASTAQDLILGKWEIESGIKVTAEFRRDGTAKLTMFGQTLRGTYKLNGDDLEWTLNGRTSKSKAKVTRTTLELTNEAHQTVVYKRVGQDSSPVL